jgi:hypothetical protein
MRKDEEIYIKQQLGYLKGKVEVYEALLYSNGILKRPEIIKFDEIRSNHE